MSGEREERTPDERPPAEEAFAMTPRPPGPGDLEPTLDHRVDLLVFVLVTVAVQSLILFALRPSPGGSGEYIIFAIFAGLFGLTQTVYLIPMMLLAVIFRRPNTAIYWLACAGVVFLLNGLFCVAGGPWM